MTECLTVIWINRQNSHNTIGLICRWCLINRSRMVQVRGRRGVRMQSSEQEGWQQKKEWQRQMRTPRAKVVRLKWEGENSTVVSHYIGIDIFQCPARRAPKVDTITNDYTSNQTIEKVWKRWILFLWQWQKNKKYILLKEMLKLRWPSVTRHDGDAVSIWYLVRDLLKLPSTK
jgi:hypothetical protein